MERKKHHFFIKFLALAIIFSGTVFYAASFPKTMELLDRGVEKTAKKIVPDIEIDCFSGFSDFSVKTVNIIMLIYENIKDKIYEEEMKKEVSPVIFTNAAFFPLETRNITSGFGERKDPLTGKNDIHTGIDIAAEAGTEIKSAWPGTVSETGYDSVYGYYVIIEHSPDFFTKYCHLSKITAEENSFVNAGEKVAEAGSTGRSTGSHLHFEVSVCGITVDPEECFEI